MIMSLNKLIIEIHLMFTSMFLCDNKSLTISIFCFLTAMNNGVL